MNLPINNIFIICLIFFCSCATNRNSIKDSDFLQLSEQYKDEYFTGIGEGSSTQEQVAIKLAKSKALGDLSNNIKVIIQSKIEINTEVTSINGKSEINESFNENILSIGSAPVRSPEYQIIKSYKEKGLFKVVVLVKKNKEDQITEAQKELNLDSDDDMIKKLLLN